MPSLKTVLIRCLAWLDSLEEDERYQIVQGLQETDDAAESALRSRLLEWLADPRRVPEMEPCQRLAFHSRLVHALYLHLQLSLAPPPGCPPWPPAEELTLSEWMWLLDDSWVFENSSWIEYWFLQHRPPADAVHWA